MTLRVALLPVLLCALLLGAPLANADGGGLRPVGAARDGGHADGARARSAGGSDASGTASRDGRNGKGSKERGDTGVLTPAETAGTPEPGGARLYNVVFAGRVADPKKATLKLAGELGFRPTHVYRNLFQGFAARMTPAQARTLAKDGRVESVSASRTYRRAAQSIPTGIRRIGATANPLADIDGSDERVDVDVMVIDGLVGNHPDLNVYRRFDCVDGSVSASDAGDDHGTHVAGTIGALDNGIGVVGVAPGARIWSVNVFKGNGAADSWIACALDIAAENGVEVANMSLGGGDYDGAGGCNENVMHRAVCDAVNAGVTVVVAAGNDGRDARLDEPANYDEVITVSALQDGDGTPANDRLADFSNYGADVDIAAPGVKVNSTVPGGYGSMSGTSMAAPHVAGAAALYLAEHPKATPAQVRQALLDHRQQVALAGDPDGRNEGVLDVGDLNSGDADPNPDPDPDPDPDGDVTPPAVAMTSPRPNGRVKRIFTVKVAASDAESGVAKVELFECSRGCRLVTNDATAPYAMKVRGSRGDYRLMVRATDNAGNVAESPVAPISIRKKKT